jgi:hypothetical protein
VEKSQTNATNATMPLHRQAICGTFEIAQWRKVKRMQPVQLRIILCKRFEGSFKNTQSRKVKQMQLVRLCIILCKRFEATFKNTQRKKAKQMPPM